MNAEDAKIIYDLIDQLKSRIDALESDVITLRGKLLG